MKAPMDANIFEQTETEFVGKDNDRKDIEAVHKRHADLCRIIDLMHDKIENLPAEGDSGCKCRLKSGPAGMMEKEKEWSKRLDHSTD